MPNINLPQVEGSKVQHLNKFYSEVTLLNQNFVIDNDKTVKEAISDFNSSNNFQLNNYVLISL